MNPDGTINKEKLENYRKKSIQFERDGAIKGFQYNADDPQGIALGAQNQKIKGFADENFNGNNYIPQIPLENEYMTDPPITNFQPHPFEFQAAQRISKRWIVERYGDRLNELQDNSVLGQLVNQADHLKVPQQNTPFNINQLNLTTEAERYWADDHMKNRSMNKNKDKENDINPYAMTENDRTIANYKEQARLQKSQIGKANRIDKGSVWI